MKKREIINCVKLLIAEGQLKEALQYLSDYVKDKDRYLENDLLLQTASFNRNTRDYANNLIAKGDHDVAMARLNHALTAIMDRLPETGNEVNCDSSEPSPPPKPSLIKILFLSANPRQTTHLALDLELRKIKDILAASTVRDSFELVSEPAVRVTTITGAMQSQKPGIVHFSGHGTGMDGIVVEDEMQNQVLFPTAGLDRLFKRFKDNVRCVVLNACYSREQAETISRYGIYVVGMNKAIGDKAAIDFAVGFYQSLGEGNDYEFAFDMAMVNISTNLTDATTPELWLDGSKLDL